MSFGKLGRPFGSREELKECNKAEFSFSEPDYLTCWNLGRCSRRSSGRSQGPCLLALSRPDEKRHATARAKQ